MIKLVFGRQGWLILVTACSVSAACLTHAAAAEKFLAPVQCDLGTECFAQQYPDTDPGPLAQDPFCGSATYDGHDGIDFRVRSLKEMNDGVPVVAVAAGIVLRVRDGEPDKLVASETDRNRVHGRECGNGVVISHPGDIETQICHLRQGSIRVHPGDTVRAGQQIGEVGASGLAQFPHVHFGVRSQGEWVDPTSGQRLLEGCREDGGSTDSMFHPEVAALLHGESFILDMGLSGRPVEYDQLVIEGAPPSATSEDPITLGWVWFGNPEKGDRIKIDILHPDGHQFASVTSDPLPRTKATFAQFAGRKRSPVNGIYQVKASIIRDGDVVLEKEKIIKVD